jgi:hypothetical protein
VLKTFKDKLDSVGATNPSKLYTPFTLFCIFFSIYLNADILGQIFLSGKWQIQEPALTAIANRPSSEWFFFVVKVLSYSLSMVFIYGLTQAMAAFIWGLADWTNTSLSVVSNKSKYVAKKDYESVVANSNELRRKERELYTRIASYHTWKPEDIDKLNDDLKEIQNELHIISKQYEESRAENVDFKEKLQSSAKEILNLTKTIQLNDEQLLNANKESSFFNGYTKALAVFKTQEMIINEDVSIPSLELFNELVSKFEARNDVKNIAMHLSNIRGNFRKDGADVYSSFTTTDQLSGSLGSAIAILESFNFIKVEIDTDSPHKPFSTEFRYTPTIDPEDMFKLYFGKDIDVL